VRPFAAYTLKWLNQKSTRTSCSCRSLYDRTQHLAGGERDDLPSREAAHLFAVGPSGGSASCGSRASAASIVDAQDASC
jgi:hypothetical protein